MARKKIRKAKKVLYARKPIGWLGMPTINKVKLYPIILFILFMLPLVSAQITIGTNNPALPYVPIGVVSSGNATNYYTTNNYNITGSNIWTNDSTSTFINGTYPNQTKFYSAIISYPDAVSGGASFLGRDVAGNNRLAFYTYGGVAQIQGLSNTQLNLQSTGATVTFGSAGTNGVGIYNQDSSWAMYVDTANKRVTYGSNVLYIDEIAKTVNVGTNSALGGTFNIYSTTGNPMVVKDTVAPYFSFYKSTSRDGWFGDGFGNGDFGIASDGGNINLYTAGTRTTTFQTDGKVSIKPAGSPAVTTKDLEIYGNNGLRLQNSSGYVLDLIPTGAHFDTNAPNGFYLDNNVTINSKLYAINNVGVGTNSPLARLHLAGMQYVDSIMMTYNSAGDYRTSLYNSFDGADPTANYLQIKVSNSTATGQTTVATFNGAGNVGIGISNATAKLDVVNGDAKFRYSPGATITIGDGQYVRASSNLYLDSSGGLVVLRAFDGGNPSFSLNNSGKAILTNAFLGIGTENPSTMLDVNGTTKLNGAVNITGNITIQNNLGLTTNKLINGSTAQCWLNYTSGILTASDC